MTGSSAATLRAYRADWTHYAAWCAASDVLPAPAAPEAVRAYLESLDTSHAPSTIRRRLAAIAKMHRFNDLPWDSGHRAIRAPLRMAREPSTSAVLTLTLLRRLLDTCDASTRGRRDRALLLFAFAGRLRRAEVVGLRVEDVAERAGGLALRIARGEGEGREVPLPRGGEAETCPIAAFRAWQELARRRAGPLFRPISRGGTIGAQALTPDAVRRILAHRAGLAGIADDLSGQLSPEALRRRPPADGQPA
jgi:integrase